MKSRKPLFLLFAALSPVAFLASSCSKSDDSGTTVQVVKDDTKVVIQDTKVTVEKAATSVKDAVSDTWDSIKDYTFDKRAEFTARTNRMAEKLDDKVHDISGKLAGLPDTAAKDEDAAMKEYKDAREDLKAKLTEMGDATADTWGDAKEKVNQAWKRVRAAYSKLKAGASG